MTIRMKGLQTFRMMLEADARARNQKLRADPLVNNQKMKVPVKNLLTLNYGDNMIGQMEKTLYLKMKSITKYNDFEAYDYDNLVIKRNGGDHNFGFVGLLI